MQVPRLREWREARALTQRELASKAGKSERSVAGYEAGGGARPGTVRALADALGVEIGELIQDFASPKVPRIFSAEWAIKVTRERMRQELKMADTAQLHKLLSELVGDDAPQTRRDLKEGRDPAISEEAFSRALEVRAVLIERGENTPENRIPAFRARLEALHLV